MTKPANFPERKRQRQIKALRRLGPATAGKPNSPSRSNHEEHLALKAAIATANRDVRTKKDRTSRGRFVRAA